MASVVQGSLFKLRVSFRDADDAPISLSGGTFRAVLTLTMDEDTPTVEFNSEDRPELFDTGGLTSGVVTVKYAGDLTQGLPIQDQREVYLQVEALVSDDQYRCNVVPVTITESAL